MVYGPRGEVLRLGPGGTDAEQGDEGRLGERRILASRLAQLGRGRGSVQHVVVDLEREAAVGAVAAQRLAHRRRGPSREAADDARRGNEGPGLAPVYVLELANAQAPPPPLPVHSLPPAPAPPPPPP